MKVTNKIYFELHVITCKSYKIVTLLHKRSEIRMLHSTSVQPQTALPVESEAV